MSVKDNKVFDKVYEKTINYLEKKVNKYYINKKYGGNVNYNELKTLLLFITYLESIDKSKYTYYHVNGLTNISNYLNKI